MKEQEQLNLINPPQINLTPGEILPWKGQFWVYKGYGQDKISGRMIIYLEHEGECRGRRAKK